MALEGTIKEFGLADIFQLIALQKKTGVLFLTGGEGTVNIYFEDGMVVKTETGQKRPSRPVGRVLINRGKITESQLMAGLDIQTSTGQKIGSVLIGQGLITKDDLRDALAHQMSEIIYRVFRWKGGDYKFYQDKVDYDRDTVAPLNSENILMDGIRMLDEWPRIEKQLPDIEVVLKKTDNARKPEREEGGDIFAGAGGAGPGLSKEAAALLKQVDGKKSVFEMLEYSSFGEFDTLKALVDLMDQGFIVRTNERPEIMKKTPETLPRAGTASVNLLDKLPFVFIAAALIVIFLQLAGARRIMSARAPDMEPIKDSFAVARVMTIYDNALLYLYDSGRYPRSVSDLVRHDYIKRGEAFDPWGGPLSVDVDENENLTITSAGPDKTLNTADDITSNP